MTGRSVLLHAATPRMIQANALKLDSAWYRSMPEPTRRAVDAAASDELHRLTTALQAAGWRCHWYALHGRDVPGLRLHQVWDVDRRRFTTLDLTRRAVDAVVPRSVGSVEANRTVLAAYLAALRDRYPGPVINDPATMIYGLRKDYLTVLSDAGVPAIPTWFHGPGVSYATLAARHRGRCVVKPVTGELANSVALLDRIDEPWLRRKQPKVGGWVVQPLLPEVWDGEFQLQFIGDACVHADRKRYLSSGSALPDQRRRKFALYEPTAGEVGLGLRLRDLWRDRLGLRCDVFRLDFFKRADDAPVVLEFETVNPGIGLGMAHMGGAHEDDIVQAFVTHLASRAADA